MYNPKKDNKNEKENKDNITIQPQENCPKEPKEKGSA